MIFREIWWDGVGCGSLEYGRILSFYCQVENAFRTDIKTLSCLEQKADVALVVYQVHK